MNRSPRLAQLQEPVWDMWLRRPKVTGQQAIALACGIDPGALDREMQRLSNGHARSVLDESPVYQWISQYQNALDSFDPAFGDALTGPRKMHHLVSLDAFARWAVDTADAISGWTVPDRLRSFVSSIGRVPVSASTAKWPWGNHTSKNLELLEATAREWWSNWDGDLRKAPTNEVVEDWLVEKKHASRKLAESIASILRPAVDVLPTGNRPAAKKAKKGKGVTPS